MHKNELRTKQKMDLPVVWKRWQPGLEIGIICLAALWIGRKYLNFDPNTVVEGGEYFLTTLSHHIWSMLKECGPCIFWNGQVNGGYPAFTELLGAPLHPLVIVTTLLLGVINGSKVVVLVSIFIVGLGQWWLAREMNLGMAARLWVSILAMVGGHVFGKLQAGDVPLVLSIASASLILPMFVRFKKDPSWRNTVLVSIILAFTWLSGQGYIQIIVILAYLPVIFIFLLQTGKTKFSLWKKAFTALLLSVGLISTLLIPLVHFIGNWQKELAHKLDWIQPFFYSLTNLVINDRKFYDTTAFDKTITPWAHINFIGWIPIILMVLGSVYLFIIKKRKDLGFLWLTMVLAFVFSSRDPYIPFRNLAFFEQLRSINVGASLAIQPLLALAAVGMNVLFNFRWPEKNLGELTQNDRVQLEITRWLALTALIFFSIRSPYQFGKQYLGIHPIKVTQQEVGMLQTESSQWVEQLNFDWLPSLLENNAKVIIPPEPWSWKGREKVGPLLRVVDSRNEPDATGIVQTLGVLDLIRDDSQEYAVVTTSNQRVPCSANALGGRIDVTCTANDGGQLVVREYYWTGWHAWIDDERTELDAEADFITLTLPPGTHTVRLEYRPWDVYAGMGLSCLGIILCCVFWWKKENSQPVTVS